MRLNNKVAIVTGGASGFGKGIVEKFINEGAKVLIADIDYESASDYANKLGKNAIALKVDVSKALDVENMIKETQPTRAESHDVYSTLKEGAQGLVLAAETAIGVNPVECVKFLKRCINVFEKRKKKLMLDPKNKDDYLFKLK